MNYLKQWLGAGCVLAATGLMSVSALAQSTGTQSTRSGQSDGQYRSQNQDVDRYTNRSGSASPYRSESYGDSGYNSQRPASRYQTGTSGSYDNRTYDSSDSSRGYDAGSGTYRSSAGQESVPGTQQWHGDRNDPTPMQYGTGDGYRTYDAGIYRDADTGREYQFRSSAGTQSAAGTQRSYGERDRDAGSDRERMIREQQARQSDYNVYGTERAGQWWQREDQAQYNPRSDRTGDRYQYERQRTTTTDRNRDVNVYYRDREQDRVVPFNYDDRTTTPRPYEGTYGTDGIERRDPDGEIYFSPDDSQSRETRIYRVERGTRSSADAVPQRQFEYRTDGGWYYDEDNRVWLRGPGQDSSSQRRMQRDRD